MRSKQKSKLNYGLWTTRYHCAKDSLHQGGQIVTSHRDLLEYHDNVKSPSETGKTETDATLMQLLHEPVGPPYNWTTIQRHTAIYSSILNINFNAFL